MYRVSITVLILFLMVALKFLLGLPFATIPGVLLILALGGLFYLFIQGD